MIWEDQLENGRSVFRKGKLKDILWYLWAYYKWQILAPLCVVGIIGSIIYSNLTTPDYVLQGIFLNTTGGLETVEELEQGFSEFCSIDTTKEDIFFDGSYYISIDEESSNSYELLQIMMARIAAGEIDFIVGELDTITSIACKEYYQEPLVLIDLNKCEKLQDLYINANNTYALAFIESSMNNENAQLFVDYLLETDNG